VLLKRICRFAYGDSLPDDLRNDGIIPVYGSNGAVGLHDSSNTSSPVIIIGRKGSYGKLNYSFKRVFAIDTTYFVDENTTKACIKWLYYILLCLELDIGSKDSAVPGLAREDAYQNYTTICGFIEQQAIASYLNRETSKIDSLTNRILESITLLHEYRSSLIHSAVTGKIDLRGYNE
jgi:type I restriction enzyme S subunit